MSINFLLRIIRRYCYRLKFSGDKLFAFFIFVFFLRKKHIAPMDKFQKIYLDEIQYRIDRFNHRPNVSKSR